MDSECYCERVVQALRRSPVMARRGFAPGDIKWYGKGMNHHDLMVITKPKWTVPSPEGVIEGYTGVNVHLESDRPGALQVHCELTPRQGSETKADQRRIACLLELKGRITKALRDQIGTYHLDRLGVNFDRVRQDAADPKSLKVMGFETRLGEGHSAEQFVAAVEPMIDAVASMIDGILAGGSPTRLCRSCSAENLTDARFCRQCGQPLAGANPSAFTGWWPAVLTMILLVLLTVGLVVAFMVHR